MTLAVVEISVLDSDFHTRFVRRAIQDDSYFWRTLSETNRDREDPFIGGPCTLHQAKTSSTSTSIFSTRTSAGAPLRINCFAVFHHASYFFSQLYTSSQTSSNPFPFSLGVHP